MLLWKLFCERHRKASPETKKAHSEYWAAAVLPYPGKAIAWDYKKAGMKPIAEGVCVVDPQTYTLVPSGSGVTGPVENKDRIYVHGTS